MIKKLYIKPGCISCKTCESICPCAFKVKWKSEVQEWWEKCDEDLILEAENNCPVNVIVADNWEEKWKNFLEWEISENFEISKDTVRVWIKIKNFNFIPGQFVSIKFNDKYWDFYRSYSILKWNENEFFLCVKLQKWWRWSNILKNLKKWKNIFFTKAKWHFTVKDNNKRKFFIWTWTWIVPLYAMAENDKKSEKIFISWFRFENEIFYNWKINQIKNLKSITTISRPTKNWKWKAWRVTDFLDEIWENDEVYICWNPNMINTVKAILAEKNFPAENIFNEFFWENEKIERNFFKRIFIKWQIPYFNFFKNFLLIFWLSIPFLYFFSADLWFSKYSLWDLSWYSVLILMSIRPLWDLFPKIEFFWKILPLRKELWIISAMVICTVLLEKFLWNPGIFFQNYFSMQKFFHWIKSFLSRMSEITWIILLLTSNNLSQKILKWFWKPIQRLSYLYFFSWWIYIFMIWKTHAIYWMIFVWIITILAFLKNRKFF